ADPAELASIPGDRVVLAPDPYTLETLAPGVRPAPGQLARERSRDPERGLPAATAAGSAHIGGLAMTAPPGGTGCYPANDWSPLATFQRATGISTVNGSSSFLTNRRLAEDGNAALAINLLATGNPVTWLGRPENPPPIVAGEQGRSLYELMPANIG